LRGFELEAQGVNAALRALRQLRQLRARFVRLAIV